MKPALFALALLLAPLVFAADNETPEALVKALYDTISGPAEKKRDPERFRSLFYEGARMVSVGEPVEGSVRRQVLTVEDYITRSFPFLERNGFFEKEVKSVTERYGNVAHVFSTYESRRSAEDANPFARGINSIQLMYDGKRWWIMSIVWQNEGPATPIPAKYLPGG